MDKQNKREMIAQYLYEAIRLDENIGSDYLKIAERNKNDYDVLRELYLCIAAKVPSKLLNIIKEDVQMAANFEQTRIRHMNKEYANVTSEKQEEFRSLLYKTDKQQQALGKKTDEILQSLRILSEGSKDIPLVPNKEERQVAISEAQLKGEKDQSPEVGKTELKTSEKPNSRVMDNSNKAICSVSNTGLIDYCPKFIKEKILNSKSSVQYMKELHLRGYKEEELSFVARCLNEGMQPAEIDEIIAIGLSVELMEEMKKLKENQKRCKNEQ